ncbi:MAG: hypothetical protein R3D86_13360 [Emcibacteraceae bacterium]
MKKLLFLIILGFSGTAHAGQYASALSQCLISNTTAADKDIMTKWVFTSLSNHPSLNNMAHLSDAVRTGADQDMARLVESFMYEKCNSQLKNAVKNEGPAALEQSIRSYVEVTGREILSDPSIAGSISGVARQLDVRKLMEALMTK